MSPTRSEREGILLSIAAFTCFVLADTCIKAVGPSRLPAYEVIACIGLVEMATLAARGASQGSIRGLWPKSPARALLRASLDLVNNLCVVIALRHLPLALFYILVFLAPAVTTVLEAIFLQESLGWKRVLAVALGFAGVVVAVNPLGATQPGDRVGYLACMVCVACFSTNMVWSRRLTQNENSSSLTFFSALLQAGVGGLLVLTHAVALTTHSAALLTITGLVSVAGALCFFRALRCAPAATVSQYHYTQLLTGALVAYAIWREKPTAFMLAGAVLIVLSGWLAAQIARAQPLAQPEV